MIYSKSSIICLPPLCAGVPRAGKIAAAYGTPVETGIEGLTHTFPDAGDIIALRCNIEEYFGALGVIASRSRSILALAEALESGEIELAGCNFRNGYRNQACTSGSYAKGAAHIV